MWHGLSVLLLLLAACGGRTGLGISAGVDGSVSDAAADGCAVAPLCGDNRRGTWRLETAQHVPMGYLFTYDGSRACNGSSTAFLLIVQQPDRACFRNGDYTIEEDTALSFRVGADCLGGSFAGGCGADPNKESITLELSRSSCDAARYDLVVHDSAPGSVYEVSAVATRCRCDIGWEPCAAPLPADPCAR